MRKSFGLNKKGDGPVWKVVAIIIALVLLIFFIYFIIKSGKFGGGLVRPII
jgi:hypothetical protein